MQGTVKMTAQYILIPVLISLAFSCVDSQVIQTVNGRIKLFVGPTSGCINARNFFRTQLVPTYELYGEYIDLEIVPWARTRREADGTIVCQFGERDCWANRLHRCVLNKLRFNQDAQLRYMACEYRDPFPAFTSRSFECVRSVGVDVTEAQFCVDNPHLDTLDEEAQAKGTDPIRIINFVPSIVINDNIDVDIHWLAFWRLHQLVCQALAADPTTSITHC